MVGGLICIGIGWSISATVSAVSTFEWSVTGGSVLLAGFAVWREWPAFDRLRLPAVRALEGAFSRPTSEELLGQLHPPVLEVGYLLVDAAKPFLVVQQGYVV